MILQPQKPAARSAVRSRSGRVAVLTALVGVVAFQLAYHVPLRVLYPKLFDIEYVNKVTNLRAKLAVKPKDQPLILALGSSLTAMALRPDALVENEPPDARHPLVYNFAVNSAGIVPQLLFLQRLLNDGIRPDWVLVESWPPFFCNSERTDPKRIIQWPVDRLLWRDLPTLARYHWSGHQLRQEWRAVQASPWYAHRHRLQSWLVPSWVPKTQRVDHTWKHIDGTGWECFPEYVEFHKSFYPDNADYMRTLRPTVQYWADKEICEDLHAALLELIELCRQQQIGVVVIWPPESSYFRECYTPEMAQRFAQWQARLRNETGVAMVNARDWVDDRKFVEGLHTNPEGATQFTRRLEQEVIRPIAEGRMGRTGGPSLEPSAK